MIGYIVVGLMAALGVYVFWSMYALDRDFPKRWASMTQAERESQEFPSITLTREIIREEIQKWHTERGER